MISELESGSDKDDQGCGWPREGADAPGSPRVAHPVAGTGQDADTCSHLRNQNIHHDENLRSVRDMFRVPIAQGGFTVRDSLD